MTRIVLRPVASSLPLGFLAFGVGTMLLTALELHWVPQSQAKTLMVMVLAFVAPLELLAGIFAFPARDSGAATALSLLGAAWTRPRPWAPDRAGRERTGDPAPAMSEPS